VFFFRWLIYYKIWNKQRKTKKENGLDKTFKTRNIKIEPKRRDKEEEKKEYNSTYRHNNLLTSPGFLLHILYHQEAFHL